MRSPSATLPYLAMGVGVVALGFSAIFVRWAAAPGPVTGLYRMAIATALITPIILRPGPRQTLSGSPGVRWAILGGVFLSLDLALWNTAINLTRAATATLFANTAPLWVALAGLWIFGERLTGRFWLGLAITLIGAAAVLGVDYAGQVNLGWGDALACGAGIFYAGYYICTQRGRTSLGPIEYVWVAGAASTITLLGISLAMGFSLTDYPSQTWLAFFGMALVSQVFGYVAISFALGHLSASLVSPTMVGQPVLTALLAIPLLGENLAPGHWLGGAAVLAGIVLIHRSRVAHPAPERSSHSN
jgi:drug/metabolite transporter (DMT)-like permease